MNSLVVKKYNNIRLNEGKGGLGFNLLLIKTENEVKEISERNNTLIYSVILTFFSLLIFFLLNIFQSIFIDTQIESIKSGITEIELNISKRSDVLLIFGELITKANLLEPKIKNKIQILDFITIAEAVSNGNKIVSYKQDNSDTYSISLLINNPESLRDVLKNSRTIDSIGDIFLKSISKDDEGDFSVVLQFKIFI